MSVTLAAGAVIAGRYELVSPLGEGGMGVVWSARHQVTRKGFALKFLRGSSHLRPDMRRRFSREARAASAVAHANIVQVFDVFELADEAPVMVMELLEGETLGSKLAREGALTLQETCEILAPVVSAVGAAHAAGIVHRDLKPENVFLCRTQSGIPDVRVLDFGIAKLVGDGAATLETGVITETGAMLGTPCYMSPEQSFGEKAIDHRADIWSLGVILYECLAGSRPVDGGSVGQVVKRLMTEGIIPISAILPSLRPEVVSLVHRMLKRERDERPQDLREVLSALQLVSGAAAVSFGPPRSVQPSSVPLSDPHDAPADSPEEPKTDDERAQPVDTSRSEMSTGGSHAFSPTRKPRQLHIPWVVTAVAVAMVFGVFTMKRVTKEATPPPQPRVAKQIVRDPTTLPSVVRAATPTPSSTADAPGSYMPQPAASARETSQVASRGALTSGKTKKDKSLQPLSPIARDVAVVAPLPATVTSTAPLPSRPAPPEGFAEEPPF